MFGVGVLELMTVLIMLVGATAVPLTIVAIIRATTAGSGDAGQPETVAAAARRGRMVSASAAAGYAVGMVVLVAMALGGRRFGLLAGAPLLAAAIGLLVLVVAGRMGAREVTGPRRTAVLNARTTELIVKTGWHLLLLGVVVALVLGQLLLLLIRRRRDTEVLAGAPLAAQLVGLGLVLLLWAFLSRAALLRPTLAEAEVAVDNALRRSDAARATRLAAIGMTQTLGFDLLMLAALADGPGAGRAGAGALGTLLVVAGPWLWAVPSARLPRATTPIVQTQPVA